MYNHGVYVFVCLTLTLCLGVGGPSLEREKALKAALAGERMGSGQGLVGHRVSLGLVSEERGVTPGVGGKGGPPRAPGPPP